MGEKLGGFVKPSIGRIGTGKGDRPAWREKESLDYDSNPFRDTSVRTKGLHPATYFVGNLGLSYAKPRPGRGNCEIPLTIYRNLCICLNRKDLRDYQQLTDHSAVYYLVNSRAGRLFSRSVGAKGPLLTLARKFGHKGLPNRRVGLSR